MSVVDDIKASVCISELAAKYTEVKGRGRLHVCRCLCGQNSDRNPSFTLYDDDNHFHCFACGRHGSAIDLVMLVEGVDFKAAVARMRSTYLLGHDNDNTRKVSRPSPLPSRNTADLSPAILNVLKAATAIYELSLAQSPNAKIYLSKRGLADATVAKMRIGYASGDLGRHLFERGLDLALAAQMGLLTPRGELMRGRIVFPVTDARGQPVWLIGRAIINTVQPKYLGLPDGLLHKQPMVLGTPRLGVIWVEGPFDLASLVQWDLDADYLLVGLLGTAHAKAIAHLQSQILDVPHYIALDQDDAGEQAADAMRTALDNDRVTRVRWASAKDCGELLKEGNAGRMRFLEAMKHSQGGDRPMP